MLDKAKIRHSFAAASSTYDSVAELQRTVGYALLQQIKPPLIGTVLELGCGTGFLTAELVSLQPELLIAVDIALPMLQTTRAKLNQHANLVYVCADAEALPLAKHSVDCIVSNLALQWCSDLPNTLQQFKQILKPNGQLIFSTFAERTLHELKTAWVSVDAYSHVNDFYTAEQLELFLRSAGFSEINLTQTLYTRHYESVWALMQELKHIGAHNVRSERNKHCTSKTAMQRMIATYETTHSVNGNIPASYDVVMVVAK